MKRKIALLLAVVMVLSLVPMMAFAASDNRVNSVPTVGDDFEFGVDGAGNFDVTKIQDAPMLRIEEKDSDWGTATQSIRLKLENAEWTDNVKEAGVAAYVYANSDVDTLKIYKDSATSVTIEFTVDRIAATDEAVLTIPMITEITDPGEAKVTVESRNGAVSEGTYVFAKSAEGKAIVTVADSVTFGTGTKAIKTIEIDESNAGAYNGKRTVTFKLPGDFTWASSVADITSAVAFRGGYPSSTAFTVTVSADKSEFEIEFTNLNTTTTRGTVFIEGLVIKADSDAKYGDVNVRVTGKDIDSTSLLVATHKDYGVTVEADGDATEIIAGKLDTDKQDEIHELQKLVIKEDIKGSWLERPTTIEFPSWVKVREVVIDGSSKFESTFDESDFSFNKNRNKIEFTPELTGDKAKLELLFYVSVEADASGDITAEVTGRALDEDYEVVLGKAVAPIEVDVEVAELRIGVQNQELGKITLTENVAGAFIKDETVEVKLEDDFRWRTEPNVEVVEGKDDLKIDRVRVEDETLSFRVTRSSDKPAVIEITDAAVDLYRTLPEGEFKVYVGGSALVQNFEDYVEATTGYDTADEKNAAFETEWVAAPVVAKVVTPAPGGVTAKGVSLTIGVVPQGGDVAPYINNSRTYAPVSAVAQALGVAKSNIIWNAEARTVTILGDKTVQMTIGSTQLVVNGTPVVMDVAPEINNNRTFLPIAWLAKALDVQYSWDAATQTVTFN